MLTLRDARPEDAPAVAGVHVRSWQVAYRGLLPDEYLDGLQAEDRAGRYTFDVTGPDQPATTVALHGQKICGFATTGPAPEGAETVGEVHAIYVDPRAWGRGVGRTLMANARARLSSLGFIEARLWVLAGNGRAERFYRAGGWLPDGQRREEDIWNIRVNEIRYRRHLP